MPSKGIQIRVDQKLKKQVERIFADLGIDTPTAVRIFFTKVAQIGGIPFDMQNDMYYRYSTQELAELDRRRAEASEDAHLSKTFNSAEDLLDDLDIAT